MVALQFSLVVMPLAVDVHQVQFVDESMALQQPKSAVYRAPVYARIDSLSLAQNLTRVEMFAGRFHHAENRAPLLRHADSALGKLRLQPARCLCLW